MTTTADASDATGIVALTKAWLEHAVIGLNLCPFAKSVYVKEQIDYRLCTATEPDQLLDALKTALQDLVDTDPEVIDTTLLIHPWVLQDFFEYNNFLDRADNLLDKAGLNGVIQIASFHPQYQFADTTPDDITNSTNRSPYPMLHLLREDSLTKAIDAVPEAATIFERNMETLRNLGPDGWQQLQDRIGTHTGSR